MAQLFDPEEVARRLSTLPKLRAAISDPFEEGDTSNSFPIARKTDRQVYHVLGNSHFLHLEKLLDAVEFCLARGFRQPTILKTCAAKPFAESIAEVIAAEHFLRAGFEVSGFDTDKGQESVPDLLLKGPGLEIAVEVYTPRVWEGIGALTEGLSELLMNLDKPKDYRFDAHIEADYISGEQPYVMPHPFAVSDALSGLNGRNYLARLEELLGDALDRGRDSIAASHQHGDLEVRTRVTLGSIRNSSGRLPSRRGAILGPTKTGFAPEGMFNRILEKSLRRKARRRQAVPYAAQSMLLVDLSYSELASELGNDYYRKEFEEAIRRQDGLEGYGALAFVDSPAWQRDLRMHFLTRETGDAGELARRLFPAGFDLAPAPQS